MEISRTEGWARKIQIRDRGVTRAIFIENGNKTGTHDSKQSHIQIGSRFPGSPNCLLMPLRLSVDAGVFSLTLWNFGYGTSRPHSLATLAKACHKFTSASKLGFPTKYKSTKARSSGGCASGVCGKGAPAWESRTGTPVALDHGTIASSFAQVRSSRVRFNSVHSNTGAGDFHFGPLF